MDDTGGIGFGVFGVLYLGLIVLMVASMWRVYTKAGQPGWSILVPIYNVYIMLKIAGKPGWWLLLMLVPFVNFVIQILVYIGIAKNFGKAGGFAAGLIILPFAFFPILAFGSAEYTESNMKETSIDSKPSTANIGAN